MATTTRKKPKAEPATSIDRDTLLGFYRTMLLSRRLDDKEIQLKQQNKIFFQISGAGHEGVQVAAAAHARPGHDWFYFYYRDRAFCLGLGMTALEQMLQAVGAEADIGSGGRQMPSHWGHPALNIVSTSSPTGTQFLQAVGTAEAGLRAKKIGDPLVEATRAGDDEIVWVTTGDGTTSEGEFWESLNSACNLKVPVLYIVEDNEYAISVPVEVNTAGGSISKLVAGFPDLFIATCDGTDVVESYEVLGRAVEHCRQRKGPALVHAKVIRPYSHSLSDDERLYRPDEERTTDAERDPVKRFGALLVEEGLVAQEELQKIKDEVDREVNEAADAALAAQQPAPETATLYVYSPDVDPTSDEFDNEEGAEVSGNAGTMVDLINRCMHEEMARDSSIVVFGQDVADCSREENLDKVKGKGGVFKVTANLQRNFGSV